MSEAKAKILVVDDQPGIRRLLTEVFSEEGYRVAAAANGYEGIQKVKDFQPDLILMDMKMPGMDGIETLRELKSMGRANRVIMMTAYGELELVNQAQQLGAFSYITKPFDIIALCSMVSEQLVGRGNADCQLKIG